MAVKLKSGGRRGGGLESSICIHMRALSKMVHSHVADKPHLYSFLGESVLGGLQRVSRSNQQLLIDKAILKF